MFWLIYLQEDWFFPVFAGDDIIPHLYGLPMDMFDCLLTYLHPAALQKLQDYLLVKLYASFPCLLYMHEYTGIDLYSIV